jgi:hypothetical protein
MTLDPETEQLKKAFFADQKCRKCGAPAERFWKNEFYCGTHFSAAQGRGDATPKFYRQSRRPEN